MKKGMFNEAAWKWSSPRGEEGWKGGGRLPKDMEIKIMVDPRVLHATRLPLSSIDRLNIINPPNYRHVKLELPWPTNSINPRA